MDAANVMTRRVICIKPDDTVPDAYAIMTEWDIRHLPVLEDGRLVGIVSDRDILKASSPDGDRGMILAQTLVADIMTRAPITCKPSAPVGDVGRLMLAEKIDSVPIVDEVGCLVGLLTSADFIQLAIERETRAMPRPIPFSFQVHRCMRPGTAAALRLAPVAAFMG